MLGAGLRDSKHLLLFEKIINVIHADAPGAKICFNSTPADTAEAVRVGCSEPRRTGDGYYESVIIDPDGNRIEICC